MRYLRFVTGQEKRSARNIVRRSNLTPRMLCIQPVLGSLLCEKPCDHRRLDKARAEAVDVDVVFGVVDAHLLRHAYNGVFGYHHFVSPKVQGEL